MATYVQELHNKSTDDTIYPVTKAQAVYLPDNTTTLAGLLSTTSQIIDLGEIANLNVDELQGVELEPNKIYRYQHTTNATNSYLSGWKGVGLVFTYGDNDNPDVISYMLQEEHASDGILMERTCYCLDQERWHDWRVINRLTKVNLTANSSIVNSFTSATRAYVKNGICYVLMNLQLKSGTHSSGSAIISGLPEPRENYVVGFGLITAASDPKAIRTLVTASGSSVALDGAITLSGNAYVNGSVAYPIKDA